MKSRILCLTIPLILLGLAACKEEGDDKESPDESADEERDDVDSGADDESEDEDDDATPSKPEATDDEEPEPEPEPEPTDDEVDDEPTDPIPDTPTPSDDPEPADDDEPSDPGPVMTMDPPPAPTNEAQDPKTDYSALPVYTEWPFDTEEAQRRQQETADILGIEVEMSVDLGDGTLLPFVLIPAGTGENGSDPSVDGFENDERLMTVTIPRPFYMGKYQVTREQYRALMGKYPENDPRNFVKMTDSPNEPALASYDEVRDEIIPRLKAVLPEGWNVRLPSLQEEYEWAARAGTTTLWYTGDTEEDLARIGWCSPTSGGVLHDVGLLEPNAWGLYDMVGNAWHWVFYAEGGGGDTDPVWHFVRGGDINTGPFGNGCRISNRQVMDVPQGYRFVLDMP